MKNRIIAFVLGSGRAGRPALAQTSPLPLPPPVEKELAARASDVTEVTLGKNMLAFAAKFMNGKDKDEAATRQLIEGLDGIYVRDYEFDKEGAVLAGRGRATAQVLRDQRVVADCARAGAEDRRVHRRDGQAGQRRNHGMFILTVEPKELTIVLILGPIRMEDLGKLKGVGRSGRAGRRGSQMAVGDAPRTKRTARRREATNEAASGGFLFAQRCCSFRLWCWPAAARADSTAWCIRSRANITCGPRAFPFMGLVSMVARGATHQGVSGLHVAEFDSFSGPVDGEELNRMVEEKLGAGLGADHPRDQPERQ